MTIPGLIIEPNPPFPRFVTLDAHGQALPEVFTGVCPDCGYTLETCQCERIALGGGYSGL